MAVCENITVQLDPSGSVSITPSDIGSTSTAECGLQSEMLSNNSFGCADVGPNMVTYTITDVNNDSDDCTAIVTVEDNIAPMAACFSPTVEIQPDGAYTLQESDVYDSANSTDNCGINNVSFPAATYDCDDEGMSFSVNVTVTDASGNSDNCTANVSVVVGNDLPSGWTSNDIGVVTIGNAYSFDPCTPSNGEFTVTGSGNNAVSTTTDNVAFASQTLCGDGMITAKIESVDPNGYGGLMIRETTAAGSKQVAIFSDLTNVLRHEARAMTNGPKQVQSFYRPLPLWLRLQRQGDWIFAYYSTTGGSFQYIHGEYVPMQSCVEIGLASFTFLPNAQTETVFSNVEVTGGNAALAEIPGNQVSSGQAQGIAQPSVFPNPTSGIANLIFEGELQREATILLCNQLGQVLRRRQLQPGDARTEWDVSALSNGLYLIEIRRDGQQTEVLRLVKTE